MKIPRAVSGRRGASLVVVMMMVSTLVVLSSVMVFTVTSHSKEVEGMRENLEAQYVCEAGLAEAVFELGKGNSGDVGSENAHVAYGDAAFWVDATLDETTDRITLVSTGIDARSAYRVESVLARRETGFFQWGAFGDEALEMASNAFVDSYESEDGPYAAINGSGSDAYANTNGDVGSNADVSMAQNSMVQGSAVPGPTGTATLLDTAYVAGSTTPMIEAVALPAVVVPSFPDGGDLVPDDEDSLASGDYAFSSLYLENNKTLNIVGPATIVFGSFELRAGSEVLVDATNGPVEIYVLDDFIMNSNTHVHSTTDTPADIAFKLLSDNVIDPDLEVDLDVVDFDSNAKLYGTIYAPNARIEINSNFELFGSLVAREVLLDSNCRIHYDETLQFQTEDGIPRYDAVCWRRLPYRP